MRKATIYSILCLCLYCYTSKAQLSIKLVPIARGFISPIGLVAPADGTGRLFVIEQGGKVKIIKKNTVLPVPFLDVSSKLDGLNIAYSEKGLLGLAFHPDYASNGRFFIFYSSPKKLPGMDHTGILAEYRVSKDNPDLAMFYSEKIILEVPEPEGNHNGGQIAFGPDGYLYVGLGDGGGANDEHGVNGNGQSLTTLLGKIIRIDINGGVPYKIPTDNPFVDKDNIRPEIWAYGLRNPWRFSFDKTINKLFCADVGQNKFEEINLIEKGKNYGWRIMEGYHCFNPAADCDRVGLTAPIYEYPHSDGVCVIGGYVYRGKEIPSLYGNYIFGDWTGKVWLLKYNDAKKEWLRSSLTIAGTLKNEVSGKINSFGEDEAGNIYIITQKLTGPKSPTGVVSKISK